LESENIILRLFFSQFGLGEKNVFYHIFSLLSSLRKIFDELFLSTQPHSSQSLFSRIVLGLSQNKQRGIHEIRDRGFCGIIFVPCFSYFFHCLVFAIGYPFMVGDGLKKIKSVFLRSCVQISMEHIFEFFECIPFSYFFRHSPNRLTIVNNCIIRYSGSEVCF